MLKKLSTVFIFAAGLLCHFSTISLYSANMEWPQVRMDNAGNTVAIWDYMDDYVQSVQVATQSNTGVWSEPITISDPALCSYYPFIEMNTQGDCIAAWLVIDPLWGSTAIAGSIKAHDSNTWSAPTLLSDSYELVDQNLSLTIDTEGDFAIAWKTYNLYTGENYAMCKTGNIQSGWNGSVEISENN